MCLRSVTTDRLSRFSWLAAVKRTPPICSRRSAARGGDGAENTPTGPSGGKKGSRNVRLAAPRAGVDPVGQQDGNLVALEGRSGGHHHRRPGDDVGGQLVGGRLAGAGGQHGQDVVAGGCGPDGLLLAGAKLLEAEGLAGQPAQAGSGQP